LLFSITILIPLSLLRPEVESDDERLPVVELVLRPVVDSRLAVVDLPVDARLPEVRVGVAELGGVIEIQFVSFNIISPLDSAVKRVIVLFPTTLGTRPSVMLTR